MLLEKVTQEKFDAAKAELVKDGATVDPGNEGVIQGHGVNAAFDYNPDTQDLEIMVSRKPFWLPEGVVEDRIQKAFSSLVIPAPAPAPAETPAA